jgi:hypothetical protein
MDDVMHVRSIAHSQFEREKAEDISQRMLGKGIITKKYIYIYIYIS